MAGVRENLRALIADIDPLDAEEAEHKAGVLAWVDSAAPFYRTAKPATPPKHLVAYCVLVDSERRSTLLVDHRDAGLWLPTGGHVDADEDPAAAARREIEEELAIRPEFHATTGPSPLMVTETETVGTSRPHTDVSVWFVFDGAEQQSLEPDDGEFVDARWWSFDDIVHGPGTRFDPNLPRFVEKLCRFIAFCC